MLTTAIVLMMAASCGRGSTAPGPAVDDVGYRDFSFSSGGVGMAGHGPTGAKPQSKLWYNDGFWWGILFDRSTDEYHIYRYNGNTYTWSETGTFVDQRNFSRADALWDGNKLYVVSAGYSYPSNIFGAHLLRYGYDAATDRYTLDAGFPVIITEGTTEMVEAVVLEKDTTDKLWVTYIQNGKVYISHTLGDDLSWGTPFVLPVGGTSVDPADDISSIIAFGDQIGVMWSNQVDDAFYFATHKDGDPEDAWQVSTVLQEPGMVNDHINLKVDSSGKVYAAVKTKRDRTNRAPDAPEILLLVRDEGGSWTSHVFGRVSDDHSRPIVLLDEEHRQLYVVATAPRETDGQLGGKIYYKRTSLDDISFEEGLGTPFIRSTTDANINDATSTKQNLNSETGLLVATSDNVSDYYFHNFIDLNAVNSAARSPGRREATFARGPRPTT
jgi:hypothetical protein